MIVAMVVLETSDLDIPGRNVIVGTTLLGAIIIAILWFLFQRHSSSSSNKNKQKKQALPPLPPKGPDFQEFFQTARLAPNQQSTTDKYGNIFTVPTPLPGIVPNQVWINDPTIVKYLTVKCANMYRPPSTFATRSEVFATATRSIVGTGVTGLTGEEWRWRKMALIKSFHKSKMLAEERGLLNKIVQEGKLLCEALGKAADLNEVVVVDLLTTKAAVGVVLYFLFGRDLKFDAEELRQAAKMLMECLGYSLFTPMYGWFKHVPGTKSYEMEQQKIKAWKIIDSVVASEIQLLLDEHEGKVQVHPDRKPGSVLATLIEEEPRFREGGVNSMIAEARVFVQAGFETTAHSLAFSLGMMAERPDLGMEMAKLGRELLGSTTTTTEEKEDGYYNVEKVKEALEKTDLVKHFFLESIRLYPLAPSLGGVCTDDVTITVDTKKEDGKDNDDSPTTSTTEYGLPKGTSVFFPNILLQRQVPNPDTIDPSRWDVPTKEAEPFLHTFQNGAHSCPGKPLSLLEGHIFLLLAATQFEFMFPEETTKVEYEDNLLLRPKDGMPLRVQRRKW